MPTIYGRWNLGFCLRFRNNLSQMCSFADFNGPKLDVYTQFIEKALDWKANHLGGNGARS